MRTGTNVVFIRLELNGRFGYGEATLPPYLDDNIESTLQFFRQEYVQSIRTDFHPDIVSAEIDLLISGNYPAKAALNIALWSLYLEIHKLEKLSSNIISSTPHSYTIGICNKAEMKQKLDEALGYGFSFFKLKLDGINDLQMIENYSALQGSPFAVDVNQGWDNINTAIEITKLLQKRGCVLIEQPFDKADRINTSLLKKQSSIPIIADEACQTLNDLYTLSDAFDGINIKLQKCGGLSAASKMIVLARSMNLKILIGCMSESSIGCNAAETLAPLSDWADLDGPWLIDNDPDMRSLFPI